MPELSTLILFLFKYLISVLVQHKNNLENMTDLWKTSEDVLLTFYQ